MKRLLSPVHETSPGLSILLVFFSNLPYAFLTSLLCQSFTGKGMTSLSLTKNVCVWLTTEGCGRAGIEGASAWKLLPFTRRTSQKPRVERTQNVPLRLSTYARVSVCSRVLEHACKETSRYVFILRFHLQLRYYAFSHFLFQVSHWSRNEATIVSGCKLWNVRFLELIF